MPEGSVISDLHLFTHRSDGAHCADEIRQGLGESDFFVLNGDIFDFRWSTFPTLDETLDAAEAWLVEALTVNPACQVHYVMGNHDCPARFAVLLEELAQRAPNFNWHPSHVRIGSNLFLHGDLPISLRPCDPFHRTPGHIERRKGKLLNLAYLALISTRLHRITDRLHSPTRCAQRIHQSLASDRTGLAEGLTDIYFGHVHYIMRDFRCNGLSFHNTGSAVRHLKSKIIRVIAD